MKEKIKSWVKSGLQQYEIDINCISGGKNNSRIYVNSLRGALSVKKPFNIVQVGANDGKYNDPIYDLVKEYRDSTNIILVEPIPDVIPYLEENYSYHPSSEIINKAVGGPGASTLQLYGVNQNYWSDINVKYGNDWPEYRIPTGVTTTNEDRMRQWISENICSNDKIENIIKEYCVDVVQPNSIVNESKEMNEVQLLQVDVEGMDDEVVYSFFESDIHPSIINIESKHLSEERQKEYDQKLRCKGYSVYNHSIGEILAIK